MTVPLGYKLAAGGIVAAGVLMLFWEKASANQVASSFPETLPSDPEPQPQLPPPPPRPIPGGPGTRPLTSFEKQTLAPYIPQIDLDSAILHVGEMPFYADWAIDASAITRGNDIYVKDPTWTFTEPHSLSVLAHELVHVGQYRNGMTWLTYLGSAIPDGYSRNNRFEAPAFQMSDRVERDLNTSMR
jgi:hypothetical protein